MKKKVLSRFALLLLSTLHFALNTNISAGTGKAGWSIFKKVKSAKHKGIITTAMVRGDLSGVLYNPAIVGTGLQRELFFISELGFTEDRFGGLVYGHPRKTGMLALGCVYYDAGLIDLYWVEGDDIRSKKVSAQQDLLGVFSYGHRFSERFYSGLTLKFATSRIVELKTAQAYAFDLGLFYLPEKILSISLENLSISLAVQNIGASTEFYKKANPLPASGMAGLGYACYINRLFFIPGLGVTYNFIDNTTIPDFGLEVGYDAVSVNLGYRFSSKGEANIHFGAGINLKTFDITYAYIPGIYLNPTHQLSMGYRFGNNK